MRAAIVALLLGACDQGSPELRVGSWRVESSELQREADRRGVGYCEVVSRLVEEELLRLDHCARHRDDADCGSGDRSRILANAVGSAARAPTTHEVAATAAESEFLRQRQPQEPGLSRKLAAARATRAEIRVRAERERRRHRVVLPAGCSSERTHGAQ